MYVIVIMSHGDDGKVYGNDNSSLNLCDIYGLLSETKFPAMAHKPKLVIIEACSGGKYRLEIESFGWGLHWKRVPATVVLLSLAY